MCVCARARACVRAGITVLWAIAASLVPAMQKGDANARSAHIAINAVILGLFTWQVRLGSCVTRMVGDSDRGLWATRVT